MKNSLVPRVASPELAASVSSQDQAGTAFFSRLPNLLIDRANLPITARHLARHLSAAGALFERGGRVVRIIPSSEGPKIERVNAHGVVLEAHKVCRPVVDRIIQGAAVQQAVTLPLSVATLYLNLGGDWDLPPLIGFCAAPLLSSDGSINYSSGYDRARGVWCVGCSTLPVIDRPTSADASAALTMVRETFYSFPFADSVQGDSQNRAVDLAKNPGADESSFLIGLLTAVCRPSLPLAPALLVRAPQLSGSGTGKGLLVHALAEIAFGQKPKAFTSRGDRQELGKRIESALMEAGPIIFLDNCNAESIASNVLAQAITEARVFCRLIGSNQMVPLNTNAFIVVTGNAVRISEDLGRRFLVVDLDAKCESPEFRRFDGDFEVILSERRDQLQAALLTIWRWGRQHPLQPGMALGSFECWASWCRDPLLALGCVDPVTRIAEQKADDPMRRNIVDIFEAFDAAHGSTPVKYRDLHPNVIVLLGAKPQTRVAKLQELENTRAGGFVLQAIQPKGTSGRKKYFVTKIAGS